MKAVRGIVGTCVPLDRSDVDTDQIIPASWLKRVERTGFGVGLFSAWRESDPSFPLNLPEYQGASILVAGPNFGVGSSREHAVWALTDYGFQAVISSRFGDIFRNNATKTGLVPVVVSQEFADKLMRAVEADPSLVIEIDVAERWIAAHEPDPSKRYVYGHSLGTAVATQLAIGDAARDGLGGLIIEGGFTSLPAMAKALAPSWLPIDWLITQKFDTIDKIAKVPAPVLIVHGTGDMLVPHRFSEALYAAARDPKRLVLVEGGGHYNTSWVGYAEYRQAISLDFQHVEAHVNLGRLLYLAGRTEEAAEVYRHWLEVAPGDPVAGHMLAACTGDAPPRASDAYVQTTFDRFAGSFDEVLARLDYQAPAHVAVAVERHFGPGNGSLDVLDAGCGTGLCGPDLRRYARHLSGVDLSPGMLAKASGRAVYDELVEAELGAFLRLHPARWDLIVSADTLCYFGDLDAVCASAATALRPGGGFIFTVESVDAAEAPAGYRIAPHGRYGHTREYVGQALAKSGLKVGAIDNVILRREANSPVHGCLSVAEKGSDGVDFEK